VLITRVAVVTTWLMIGAIAGHRLAAYSQQP